MKYHVDVDTDVICEGSKVVWTHVDKDCGDITRIVGVVSNREVVYGTESEYPTTIRRARRLLSWRRCKSFSGFLKDRWII